MNGKPLNIYRGGPLRLRCENEGGFKQVRWSEFIEFVEDHKTLGAGPGGFKVDRAVCSWREPI